MSEILEKIKDFLIEACGENDLEAFSGFSKILLENVQYNQSRQEVDELFTRMIMFGLPYRNIIFKILELYVKLNPGIIPAPYTYVHTLPFEKFLPKDEVKTIFETIALYLFEPEEETKETVIGEENEFQLNPSEILDEIITIDHPKSALFIERVFFAFPIEKFTRVMLEPLVEKANEKSVHSFEPLFNALTEVSPFAPIPLWVRNFVYDPYKFPLEKNWYVQRKDRKRFETHTVEKAIKEGVPFWIAQTDFDYKGSEDPESIYLLIEQQDTSEGHFIDDSDEFADFDKKGEQLPFEEDIQVPEYPSVYSAGDVLEVIPDYWDELWSYIESEVDQEKIINVDTEPEEEFQFLKHRVLSMPLFKLNLLFGNILGAISYDDMLVDAAYVRIMGPRNAIPSDDNKDGGERMLTCNVYDFDEEENEEYNWFLGFCLNCGLRIRRLTHALRLPVLGGGWKGCYCSPECALKQIDLEDTITPRILQEVVEDLHVIGVQDFTKSPEEEEEEEE